MLTLSPVYHGTNKRFKEFSNNSALTWFTSDKNYAKGFTSKKDPHIIEAEITISNPLILGDIDAFEQQFDSVSEFYSKCLSPIAKTISVDNKCDINEVLAELLSLYSNNKVAGILFELVNSSDFKKFLIKYNYDGVLAEETEVETYGVVNANQIKIVDNLREMLLTESNEERIEHLRKLIKTQDIEILTQTTYKNKDNNVINFSIILLQHAKNNLNEIKRKQSQEVKFLSRLQTALTFSLPSLERSGYFEYEGVRTNHSEPIYVIRPKLGTHGELRLYGIRMFDEKESKDYFIVATCLLKKKNKFQQDKIKGFVNI